MKMNLTGVTAYATQLAEALAALLKKHGYIQETPADHVELIAAAKKATAPAPYLTGHWNHIFPDSRSESTVRLVFSRADNKILAMQLYRSGRYVEASAGAIADVQDSLLNANSEALDAPEDFGLSEAMSLPGWAPSTMRAREAMQKTITCAAGFYGVESDALAKELSSKDSAAWVKYRNLAIDKIRGMVLDADWSEDMLRDLESLSPAWLLAAAMYVSGRRSVESDIAGLPDQDSPDDRPVEGDEKSSAPGL